MGRGQVRGRRVNEESMDKLIRTKPQHIVSKRASSTNQNLQKAMFTVNYYKLNKAPTWTLNLYRVDFNPPEDILPIKRGLLGAHRPAFGSYLFDGTMLFTQKMLPGGVATFMSKKRDEAETMVEITVKHVRVLEYGDFQYIQLYNILMRDILRALELQIMGRDYFDPAAKQAIPEFKMEVWPGYETVIRQHEQDLLMCVGIKHKVLRKESALEVWLKCKNDQRQYESIMTNATVLTQYNNRTFKVDDIDFTTNPTMTFSMKGENITYIQYYQQKYNITIREPQQPMIIHKSKGRELRAGQAELIYLVPELCFLTGLTDEMRANFRLMKALGDITRVPPRDIMSKLVTFRKRIENSAAKDVFKPWDLALDRDLVKVQGHILQPETIVLGADARGPFHGGPEADWTKHMRSNSLFRSCALDRWALVTTNFMQQDTRQFVGLIQKAANGMKMRVSIPREFIIPNDRAQTYALELEKILSSETYTLVMCIIPSNQADRYNAIKRKCAIDRATPSQVIVKKNLNSKGSMSIATKVAVQLLCKIGGAPWTVEVPMKGMMVLGFDVTHDTDLKGSSYGALVASMDPSLSSWFSVVSPHRTGNELSDDIASNITQALQAYKERNQAYPKALVFYRDGVGEGQINQLVEHELNHIQNAIAEAKIYEAGKIPLSFVIVTKRIHSRIMTDAGNPPPGSVVDDTITCPERYDFFLVSQSVRQGTVTPTYYNVVHDTNPSINPERLQRLTYKLCHLYYNWSGTVRVPAPCQYAHKLAFLCGQSLHRAPDNSLRNLLHYL